jgi:GntR family transcriptional regulator of gluconate operon
MSVVDLAAKEIRALVLSGRVKPGERLAELPLAARLGVSRPTVREALRRLESRGLLASDGRGLLVARLDADELRSALLTRSSLEGLHAGLAAARVRAGEVAPAQLRYLRELARAAARTGIGQRRRALDDDRAFHRAIDELAGSPVGAAMLAALWDRLIAGGPRVLDPTRPTRSGGDATASATEEHRAILDAIESGKPRRAREAATRHVRGALQRRAAPRG